LADDIGTGVDCGCSGGDDGVDSGSGVYCGGVVVVVAVRVSVGGGSGGSARNGWHFSDYPQPVLMITKVAIVIVHGHCSK